jgi:hypothetical protein
MICLLRGGVPKKRNFFIILVVWRAQWNNVLSVSSCSRFFKQCYYRSVSPFFVGVHSTTGVTSMAPDERNGSNFSSAVDSTNSHMESPSSSSSRAVPEVSSSSVKSTAVGANEGGPESHLLNTSEAQRGLWVLGIAASMLVFQRGFSVDKTIKKP